MVKEIARLEKIKKCAETIRSSVEKIAEEVGKGEQQLRRSVRNAGA